MRSKRETNGKFALKGKEPRHTRTLRLTNSAWAELQKLSTELNKSKSDVIEEALSNNDVPSITWLHNALALLDKEVDSKGFSINKKALEEAAKNLRDFINEVSPIVK